MIKEIRQEIFRLAKRAKDLETMHWYIVLDNCFENNELQIDEIENLKWRAAVLNLKQEPVNRLLWMIDSVIRPHLDIVPNINEIKERLDGISGLTHMGPWFLIHTPKYLIPTSQKPDGKDFSEPITVASPAHTEELLTIWTYLLPTEKIANFVANAPTDIKFLLDLVERLQKED